MDAINSGDDQNCLKKKSCRSFFEDQLYATIFLFSPNKDKQWFNNDERETEEEEEEKRKEWLCLFFLKNN